jgi:hypothetical protein
MKFVSIRLDSDGAAHVRNDVLPPKFETQNTSTHLCLISIMAAMLKRKASLGDDDDEFDDDFGLEEEEFEEEENEYAPELKRSKSDGGDGLADDAEDEEKSSGINKWRRTVVPQVEEAKQSIGMFDRTRCRRYIL